jgi:hypothetical protein
MFIGELLIKRNHVKMQINEFKKYLYSDEPISDINDVLDKLFTLEDKHQQYSVVLDDINMNTEIQFGDNKVIIANMIKLRDTTSNKINVFTELIDSNKSSLNIINLIDQRANLVEEYILLNKTISTNDWQVEID